jgi:hypothetical protein
MPAAVPALIAAGGAIIGGLIASKGSKDAAQTQVDAANSAASIQDKQYQQTRTDQLAQYEQVRADQAPYREAAIPSIANLSKGLQPGGEYGKAFGIADYMADPGYQFRLQQGEQGINRAASARG